jgi:pyruvate dehydrogenase E1 component
VRGNGKIVQELEGEFRGSGWNVIKLLWGTRWDTLFQKDTAGLLIKRFEQCVDGEFQTYRSKNAAYVREFFFNSPELKELIADWSDEEIWGLNRGGHDPFKVFAAFHQAVNHKGQPTVILAKTIKGYGMGASGEAQNITHQQKHISVEDLQKFRDKYKLPLTNHQLEDEIPYLKFDEGSEELEYMRKKRMDLGGYLPQRREKSTSLKVPNLSAFDALLKATAEGREISTTMAFVRILNTLVKDKELGKYIVPIVPDESRTFGMEGMFRQLGIWSHVGQLYTPQDHDQLMFYKEDKKGQILQEGINEAGAMCDWIAAGTSYSTHNVPMIPFYIFYSMFGFQRIGDLCWAAADMRTRGFLLGGTAGRTTLNGEGLQHEDGHSHIWSAAIPNCISYDPTFAYELAVIVQNGLERMYAKQEDVYYYITVMNENYTHPALPTTKNISESIEQDIINGMYSFGHNDKAQVQLLGSGTIMREVIAASELLKNDWNIESNIWGCPSFTELARNGQNIERYNMLNPLQTSKKSHVEQCLQDSNGPVIAASDYVRAFTEQIRAFIPNNKYVTLGTDGFGRSDTREQLRHFFEVNSHWITIATLKALADEKVIKMDVVAQAIAKYGIDIAKPNPMSV